MTIFQNELENWYDLQVKVSQVFNEIGYETEVDKTIQTSRGKVDIDVYVRDFSIEPNLNYLCECKFWESKIPKSVIHSFRSVVSDYGANVGYLISKNGFQSGALEAAKNSNITLLTWDEFQISFYDKWLKGMWKRIHLNCKGIKKIMSPDFCGTVFNNLEANKEAKELHTNMYFKFISLSTFFYNEHPIYELLELPIKFIDPRMDFNGDIEVRSHREYFDILLSSIDFANEAFNYLDEKYHLSKNSS